MAQAMVSGTKLRLVFVTGTDEKGNPILRTKSFNNLKKEATADQMYQVAQAIGNLSADGLDTVQRVDSSEIFA
jgi:hypothetical protein